MHYKALMSAIKLMGQGMTAIFIAMILISGIVYLLTRFLSKEMNDQA